MSLDKYKEKRSFDKTPEPTGGKPTDKKLRFVVQKHHASHLHYDFRLEMKGVLKSWAVPKGPSMNPDDKRLAMMVEDHLWDYRNFEGIIPSGYGAGTVIVWDEGSYEPVEKKKTKKEEEHSLLHHLYQGSLSFILHGKKLKGEFALVKTAQRGENAWLLIKKKDKYAAAIDIVKKDKSVLSNKTLEQVAADPEREWQSHKPAAGSKAKVRQDGKMADQLKKGKKAAMPAKFSAMLCTRIKEPFNDEDWVYEVKWDGYRILAFIKNGKVTLKTRGNRDYTEKYSPVTSALTKTAHAAIIDGEVVVLDENGSPDFSALQNYKSTDVIAFYVFDLPWCDGYNLTSLPLTERKNILREIIPDGDVVRLSEGFDDGIALFDSIKKMGVEGIVAKKKDSIYTPGKKGNTWYKLKQTKHQEYVIGGWNESSSGRAFRSLIFGHYIDGKLTYVHHSGGGFTDKQMKELKTKLKKLEIPESPFVNKVPTKTRSHWARPELVGEFEKSTKTTKSGAIRHPAIFIGLREDKDPKDVVKEVAEPVELDKKNNEQSSPPQHDNNENGSWEILSKRKITSENKLSVEGHEINLINIERELWPGITKADLIEYYISISDYLLPNLKERPLGINIAIDNPAKGGFFIRGMEGRAPDWATIFTTERKHKKKGKSDIIEWLVCNNKATLVFIINLGTIDLHPWTSKTTWPDKPDYIIIDLDPSDDDFKKAIDTALAAKKIFAGHKLKSFVKTSGKTGLHLLLPCNDIDFGESRKIAEKICNEIHEAVPDITTTNVSVNSRGSLLYIDPNQNDYADRVAAPYCVRAYHIPTVSTPLEWKEVNSKLKATDFTIKTIRERLEKKGDLFKNLYDEKIRNANGKILKKLLNE